MIARLRQHLVVVTPHALGSRCGGEEEDYVMLMVKQNLLIKIPGASPTRLKLVRRLVAKRIIHDPQLDSGLMIGIKFTLFYTRLRDPNTCVEGDGGKSETVLAKRYGRWCADPVL